MSKASIKAELRSVLHDVEDQMTEVGKLVEGMPGVSSPYQIRDMNGNFIMIPLLVAQAHILSAIAGLEK